VSIYSKSVSEISTDDLKELLTELPVENLRLEFKLLTPDKAEFLKKASGFANAYGGLMVIGAAANKDGKLVSLPGVEPEAGLKQRLVSWGFEGLYPPLEVFVSDPVPASAGSTKVCYVVSVPESLVAPHFISGRKGAYVRTDEFSGRFEPQLATYNEIAHLADRRALSIVRRGQLLERAESRFRALEVKAVQPLGAIFTLFTCPAYPARTIVMQDELTRTLGSAIGHWRGTGFPIIGNEISQHESIVLLNPTGGLSSLEATTWGSLFYAEDVQAKLNDSPDTPPVVHLNRLVGGLLVFLAHAGRYLTKAGFDGLVWIRPELSRITGRELWSGKLRSPGLGSPIDGEVTFDLTISSDRLKNDRDGVARDILRTLLFALNWGPTDDSSIMNVMNIGYEYNSWQLRSY
jgi:hypothetical protein